MTSIYSWVMVVLMKKLSLYILISLMVSWSAISDDMNSVNKLIEDGYKIISEDIVSKQSSTRFIKVFTLQMYQIALHVFCQNH